MNALPGRVPRYFGPLIAFGSKAQILVAKQNGRETSVPRAHVTYPFHPLFQFVITSHCYV